MTRLEESFFIPERSETVGASLDSARELVDLGEECILLKATHTEKALGQIATRGEYAAYLDVGHALEHRYVMEGNHPRALRPNQIHAQSTRQWKQYIRLLRPSLYGVIEEFNNESWLPDPESPQNHFIPAKWVSRSLVYRTVISRKGLERLISPDQPVKLGKQTLATIKILVDTLEVEEGYGEA